MSMSFIRIELFVNSRYLEFAMLHERKRDYKSHAPFFQITNLEERLYFQKSDHLVSILNT